jgi:hypothetical protein
VAKTSKVPALVLADRNAPASPHHIPGLAGLYFPHEPTPLGGPGECTLEDAKAFVKAHAEQVKQARVDWERFEAEQVKHGLRDNGPLEFTEPSCPVELAELSEAQAERRRDQLAELYPAVLAELAAARRRAKADGVAAEFEQSTDEIAALSGKED